jgi:hypothetical protein
MRLNALKINFNIMIVQIYIEALKPLKIDCRAFKDYLSVDILLTNAYKKLRIVEKCKNCTRKMYDIIAKAYKLNKNIKSGRKHLLFTEKNAIIHLDRYSNEKQNLILSYYFFCYLSIVILKKERRILWLKIK